MCKTGKMLILGVGSAKKDAIEYLKRTGWFVIGCSYLSEGPGFDLGRVIETGVTTPF